MNLPSGAGVFFRPQMQDALSEGVEIVNPAEISSINPLSTGGYHCTFIKGDEQIGMDADRVYCAASIVNDIPLLASQGLQTTEHGVQVNRKTLETSLSGVFAAGNVVRPGRYAVHASAAAHLAARSITRYLAGISLESKEPINVKMGQLSDHHKAILFAGYQKLTRMSGSKIPPASAKTSFAEVECGLSLEEAVKEAARCLDCDCAKKKSCLLRDLSTEYEADTKAYAGEKPPFERDVTHEEIVYESGKCIKCGRCIAIAEKQKDRLGMTFIGRGFHVKVGVPFGGGLKNALRACALECAEACPTGALSKKR